MMKFFIGTEPRMWLGNAVLKYSIAKHAQSEFEIVEMDYSLGDENWEGWNIGRELGVPATRTIGANGEAVWFTDFTNFRWAIPEVCGFEGRAIYNDIDQIYLKAPEELWELDMGGKPVLSLTANETSVMLFDCAKFKDLDWWPSIEEMKASGWNIKHYIRLLMEHDFYGNLPTRWNCLDGRNYGDGYTGLVHYTDMSGQLWRPYPERLRYHRHTPEMEKIWMDLYFEALEAGVIPDAPPPGGEMPEGVEATFPAFVETYKAEHNL